jgi:hypothetical protein
VVFFFFLNLVEKVSCKRCEGKGYIIKKKGINAIVHCYQEKRNITVVISNIQSHCIKYWESSVLQI